VSITDDQRDQVYRHVLGWPIPRKPTTPVAIVEDLRQLLADRRRRLERKHPKVEVPRG
jgi:hypothetical protein